MEQLNVVKWVNTFSFKPKIDRVRVDTSLGGDMRCCRLLQAEADTSTAIVVIAESTTHIGRN